MSMGSHQSAVPLKEEWLTPREITTALGVFDLDPCAPINPPWPIAEHTYTVHDNGLQHPWRGRVWLNPPYGRKTRLWLATMAKHNYGTALIFARTETADWHDYIWRRASAILFLRGRLHFHHVNGDRASANAGAPSALVAYGERDAVILQDSGIAGAFVTNWSSV